MEKEFSKDLMLQNELGQKSIKIYLNKKRVTARGITKIKNADNF